jgi:mono/diheme cytochrome c family protein
MKFWGISFLISAVAWPSAWLSRVHAAEEKAPELSTGLAVAFRAKAGGQTDHTVRPHFMLFVPAGEAASPFVAPGPFTAEWEGVIHLDLRDRFIFQAELNGSLKLELNGKLVVEETGAGGMTEPTKRIRLNSRSNILKATYTAPEKGDAFFRLYWSTPDYGNEPIPARFLKHVSNESTAKGTVLRRGRQLAAEHRCFKCHAAEVSKSGMPELAMDAPTFKGIGSRRGIDWMADWVLNPKKLRPSAKMPAMLYGATAAADAKAIAAYLGTLKSAQPVSVMEVDAAAISSGQALFKQLNCAACHTLANEPVVSGKLALGQARRKFGQAGVLAAFLKNPQSHYRWIRMPNFALNDEEANALAAYLFSEATPAKGSPLSSDVSLIASGKKLVTTTGCLNCHELKSENEFSVAAIADLAKGCLAESPAEASVRFGFAAEDRLALQQFLNEGRASLGQANLAEFAQRQTADSNCTQCHGQMENVPPFVVLGGKLKPEWAQKLLGGTLVKRPRPWLHARMPAFPARADGLAKGLAMLHGHSPVTPKEPAIDLEKAKIGRQLVSANGGFFCFSCHAIGSLKPAQVFDAQGINLAQIGDRLLPEYFRRWMSNPLRVDPQTKMPAYFNQGQSALFEILDGDAGQQIEALHHYIRQGEAMVPPEAPGQ